MAGKKISSKPIILIPLVIIILLLLIGLTLFSQNNKTINYVKPAGERQTACLSERSQKGEFLETYIVKKGDTLLSISKNQLKDVSRIGELIELNKDRYPELSVKSPFLEQGWGLYLPPDSTIRTSGSIAQVKGVIKSIRENDGAWEIGSASTPGHYAALSVNKNTVISTGINPKVGDCIKALVDEKTGEVYSVSFQ